MELEALGEVGLAEGSACSEWSVGRVVAHLGRGAEIALRTLDAALAPDQQETLVVPFFTGPKPLSFGAFRLAEHAVHTWDVAVTPDPADELAPEMAQIVLDAVVAPMVGQLASNPGPGESVVGVHLSDTGRSLVLEFDPTVGLRAPRPGEAPEARLDISTAAFVRLVYGRLDRRPHP